MSHNLLLGAAFGSLVHLSPAQREQGAEMWGRIRDWAENLTPTQKAAIATLRLAEHLNVDSTPGKPATPADVEAHVNRMRTAIEQLERGRPVDVSDLPEPRFEADPKRMEEMQHRADDLVREAERVRTTEGIPEITDQAPAPEIPPVDLGAPAMVDASVERGAGAEAADPVRMAADQFVAEQPDRLIRVGTDTEGAPIVKTAREYLDDARAASKRATEDAKLFEVAAACLLGGR
jgi:hypothetical protein